MCGRYQLTSDPRPRLEELGIRDRLSEAWRPRWNIAPHQPAPVIHLPAGAEPVLAEMRWGYVPHWVGDENPRAQPINARRESVAGKPYFRESLHHRRCVIPATGFYEWQQREHGKQPYRVSGREPFLYMAGVWDTWHRPSGSVDTFAILTTRATGPMERIHHRMPVLLPEARLHDWLAAYDPALTEPAEREQCAELQLQPISTAINNPRNDSPDAVVVRDRRSGVSCSGP